MLARGQVLLGALSVGTIGPVIGQLIAAQTAAHEIYEVGIAPVDFGLIVLSMIFVLPLPIKHFALYLR
jgi:hypothetical protein